MVDEQLPIFTPASSSWTTPSSVALPSGRVTPRSKSKGMVQADHSYSKRKMSSESSGQSSQESADVPNNPLPNLAPPTLSPVSTKALSQGDISTAVLTTPPKLSRSLPSLNLTTSPSSHGQHSTASLIDVLNLSIPTPDGAAVSPPASPPAQHLSMKNVFNNMISNMITKHLLSDRNPSPSPMTEPPRLSDVHQVAPAKTLPALPSLAEEQPGSIAVIGAAEVSIHSSPSPLVHIGNDTPNAMEENDNGGIVVPVAPSGSDQIEPVGSQKDCIDLMPISRQSVGPIDKDEPMDIIEHYAHGPSTSHTTSGALSPAGGATTGAMPSAVPSAKNYVAPTTVKCEDRKDSSMVDDSNKSDHVVSVCVNTPGKTELDVEQLPEGKSAMEANIPMISEEPNAKSEQQPGNKSSDQDDQAATDEVDEHTRRVRLMDMCIKAMALCLNRFPQHYKSLYRLAYIYFHSPDHKVAALVIAFVRIPQTHG